MCITRSGVILVITLVFILTIALCAWTAAGWSRSRPYHWQRVESPDAAFSISFPATPQASRLKQADPIDGSEFVSNRLEVSPAPRIGYMVSWWDDQQQRNKPTEELFAHFRDCDEKVFRGKAKTKAFTVQGNAAIDIVVVNPEGTVVNRVVRAGRRIYSLWAYEPSARIAIDGKNVRQFLDSFSLH